MSKAFYVRSRDGTRPLTERTARRIVDRILPDHFSPNEPTIIRDEGALLAVANPVDGLHQEGTSACLGVMFPPDEEWTTPGTDLPDGSYALFRSDERRTEVSTDIVGSRTIWYYKNDDVFVAATSQRAVVNVLGSFEPNDAAAAWLISSGTLGPGLSWDRRIRSVPPDGRLVLDVERWALERHRADCEFRAQGGAKAALSDRLETSLDETFADLDLDFSRWVLPVSGGVDSRYLLHRLSDCDPECVTWGLPEDRHQQYNDAAIAEQLFDHYGVEHRFYDLTPTLDAETVFDRFLVAGEGRVDHLSGYLDGFHMWADMLERGNVGIVRGDEGFGWLPVLTAYDVRRTVGTLEVSDWPKLSSLQVPGEDDQHLPSHLQRPYNETLETWRDRLYHQFRIPYLLAALNDLKLPYVEIANPFLSREIIETVRTLPDECRTKKRLYREHVNSVGPDVPEAKYGTGPSTERYLRHEEPLALIRDTLDTDFARDVLSDRLITHMLENVETVTVDDADPDIPSQLYAYLKENIPQTIENVLLTWVIDRTIEPNRLAFRGYLAVRMHDLLQTDATSIR